MVPTETPIPDSPVVETHRRTDMVRTGNHSTALDTDDVGGQRPPPVRAVPDVTDSTRTNRTQDPSASVPQLQRTTSVTASQVQEGEGGMAGAAIMSASPDRPFFVHVTHATDLGSMRVVIRTVKEQIVLKALVKVGFLLK